MQTDVRDAWSLQKEIRDFLKVSPMKGIIRTGGKNKLDPRYIGPSEIL